MFSAKGSYTHIFIYVRFCWRRRHSYLPPLSSFCLHIYFQPPSWKWPISLKLRRYRPATHQTPENQSTQVSSRTYIELKLVTLGLWFRIICSAVFILAQTMKPITFTKFWNVIDVYPKPTHLKLYIQVLFVFF